MAIKEILNNWFKNFVKKSKMLCNENETDKFEKEFKALFGEGIRQMSIDSAPIYISSFSHVVSSIDYSDENFSYVKEFYYTKFNALPEFYRGFIVLAKTNQGAYELYKDIYNKMKDLFGSDYDPLFLSVGGGSVKNFDSAKLASSMSTAINNKGSTTAKPTGASIKIIGVFLDSNVKDILDKSLESKEKLNVSIGGVSTKRPYFKVLENPVDEIKKVYAVIDTSEGTLPKFSKGVMFVPGEYLFQNFSNVADIPYFYIVVDGVNLNAVKSGLSLADIPAEYLPPPTITGVRPDGSVDVETIKGIIRSKYSEVVASHSSDLKRYFGDTDAIILADIESSLNPRRLRWNFSYPKDRSIGLFQITLLTFESLKKGEPEFADSHPSVMYDPEVSSRLALKYLINIFETKIKSAIRSGKLPDNKYAVLSALFCAYNKGPGYLNTEIYSYAAKHGMVPCYHWLKYVNKAPSYGINVAVSQDFRNLLEQIKQKELAHVSHSGKTATV